MGRPMPSVSKGGPSSPCVHARASVPPFGDNGAASPAPTPYFSISQVTSLEQLSDEEFRLYAKQIADAAPSQASPQEYLRCGLLQGQCLIPLTALFEVLPPPYRYTLLPAMPVWMYGILAWRGEVVAVIDLAAYLLGHAPLIPQNTSTLLIADHEGLPVGLLLPTVEATLALDDSKIIAPAEGVAPARLPCHGIYEEAVIIDVATLLGQLVQQIEAASL